MFKPFTDRIEKIANISSAVVSQLETLFSGNVNVYIDHANVRPWANKLGWHIDYRRLKQLFDSFDNFHAVKIYTGTLVGDLASESLIKDLTEWKYDIRTKPVKIMRMSIDVTSIHPQSPILLNHFIRAALLRRLDVATIEYLNDKLRQMNAAGQFFLEDRKCNFDVEIGRDMLIDHDRNDVDTFILWSGDSDFAEPVRQLLADKKRVVLFATARRVSTELNALQSDGLMIFDIQKIKNFICWKKEMR
jgi:uncharacterized LabA/DUF88 family protein